jgi:hypothetical protein
MSDSPHRPPTEQELRELAALADGSLAPERRAAVEARVAASPRLQALLAEQRQAVRAFRERRETAPESLRAAVAAERRRRAQPGARRLRVGAGLTAAAVALGVALVLVLPGSETGAPTVAEASQLAAKAPQRPPPGLYPEHPALLDLEVAEVAYPNWEKRFGWRATGARTDRVDGRDTRTLFYERGGRRLAYTIVSGRPISPPAGSRGYLRDGTKLHGFRIDGRTVVTWERRHHTCVLSGTGVSREALLRLGAWKRGGAIPY